MCTTPELMLIIEQILLELIHVYSRLNAVTRLRLTVYLRILYSLHCIHVSIQKVSARSSRPNGIIARLFTLFTYHILQTIFFLYFEKKVPVRRTGAYRHKKALVRLYLPPPIPKIHYSEINFLAFVLANLSMITSLYFSTASISTHRDALS